jgi:prepilin-type processing-associated H-X9-DG protein
MIKSPPLRRSPPPAFRATSASADVRHWNVRLQKNYSPSAVIGTGSTWDFSLAYHLHDGKPRIVTIVFLDGSVEKFQFVPMC